MEDHKATRRETLADDVDDVGVAPAKFDKNYLRLLPQPGATLRGGIDETTFVFVNPTSEGYKGLAGNSQITFQLTSTADEMIDLANSYVETQVQITVGFGTPAADRAPNSEDRILLKNAAAALMWQSVDVRLNDTGISDQCHLDQTGASPGLAHLLRTLEERDAPYGCSSASRVWQPSYDETVLDQSQIGLQVQVRNGAATVGSGVFTSGIAGASCGDMGALEGYAWAQKPWQSGPTDTPVANAYNTTMGENDCRPVGPGSWARHVPVVGSTDVNCTTLLYRPACSLFQSMTPLPPGSRVGLTLTKNNPSMWIQAQVYAAAAAGVISSVSVNYVFSRMWVAKIRPTPTVNQLIREYLLAKPYQYSFITRRVQSYTIAAGQSSFSRGGILQGPMPSRVWVFLSRGFYADTAANMYRCSPWAASPQSLVANNAAGNYASLEIPLITQAYVRIGARQFPLVYPYQASGTATLPRTDSWRAYQEFMRATNRSIFGANAPLISYEQFEGNYLFYTFSILPDPDDPIATTLGDTTSALASTSGLDLFLQFSANVANPAAPNAAPALRVVICAESPGSVEVSAQGGVSKYGF